MNNLSGTNLKGYELLERIGAGGFGAVYRARQTTIDREVAVKIILPGLANEPDFIRRFETEARLIARLEHPHITPLHDFWRDPDGAYLVMRYLRGGSLRDAISKEGAYDLESTSRLLDQIASALDLAHRNEVIHRDIKPGNILLDEDGNAYLADFGIAKDLINVRDGHTSPDSVVGSLDYISPEQARSEPVTPRTDIYSLGITLYEMITGEHPFKECSSVERLYKHINDPLPAITDLSEDVRDSINEIIHRATAKNPDQRYPDVLALAVAFREAIGWGDTSRDLSIVEQLTWREQEVLQLVAEGRSNKEIADQLFVTLATVRWHIRQVYKKLGVRGRVQAIVRARELDLLVSSDADLQPVKAPATVISLPEPQNPYKGLRAFEAADSRDFFGREEFTEKLIRRMGENERFSRFLAVIGPSGSGKSSLVKAGLIPALWKGGLPGSERWFVVEMIPGSRPLDQLEVALVRVAARQIGALHEQLTRDENGLLRLADIILPSDQTELVLMVDQFEEVFTLVDDERERVQFLNLLHAAVTDKRSRVRVIVTLRADYYDRPLHYPEFGEILRSRMETVLPLSAKGIERAIARPAERVGVTFEPGLVAQMVSEMNYQAGALPLLQYALTELFDRRQGRIMSHQSYNDIGGAVGALAHRADEIYASFDVPGQEIARQMLLRLVTLGEGAEDTRRRTPRSELLQLMENVDLMDDIIDTFADYRLLSLDNDPGTRQPTVEVAHEAILREWERLRGWLNTSREDIRQERAVAQVAAEWERAHRDKSYLLHGVRLEQVEAWHKLTELALTPLERDFIAESSAERERQQVTERERQAREAALERRSVRFLRALVGVLLVATLGAFGLVGVAVNQSQIAQHNAAEVQNVALIAGSQSALANDNSDEAVALALQAVTLNPDSARAQVALGQAAYAPGTVRRFADHAGEISGVAFSPDGRMALTSADDRRLILWDVATGEIIRQFANGHTEGHIKVDFSPDGGTALSGAGDGLVILWDVATGNIIRRFEGHTGWVRDVRFSPDGQTALSCGQDKTLILWDVASGAIIRRFTGHTDSVESIAFSADGHMALSGSDDKTLILWDIATGDMLHQFGSEAAIRSVDLSEDGRYAISSGTEDTLVYLWDVATGQIIRRFTGHTGPVQDIQLSPDSVHMVSGAEDGTLIEWDVETGQIVRRFVGHSAGIRRVAFSSDGRYILSGSADSTARLWDLEAGYIIRPFASHPGWIIGLRISPDGQTALSSSWAGTASLLDLQTGQERYRLTESTTLNWSAYSPDGHTAIIAEGVGQGFTRDVPGGIIVWDLDTGEITRRLTWEQPLIGLDFRPDGQTFLAGAADGSVLLWDVAAGEVIRRFTGHTAQVIHVRFSPDGRTALTGAVDGSLLLWDVETGELIRRFIGQTDLVAHINFSADGRTALTAGSTNGTNLWDIASGQLLRHFDGGSAFSPDGQLIFGHSSSKLGGNSAVLIDLGTGTIVRHFNGLDGYPISNAFLPDGRSVLVGYSNGKLEQWRLDTLDELLAWTRANRYIPDLTCEQRALYRLEPLCEETDVSPTTGPG